MLARVVPWAVHLAMAPDAGAACLEVVITAVVEAQPLLPAAQVQQALPVVQVAQARPEHLWLRASFYPAQQQVQEQVVLTVVAVVVVAAAVVANNPDLMMLAAAAAVVVPAAAVEQVEQAEQVVAVHMLYFCIATEPAEILQIASSMPALRAPVVPAD